MLKKDNAFANQYINENGVDIAYIAIESNRIEISSENSSPQNVLNWRNCTGGSVSRDCKFKCGRREEFQHWWRRRTILQALLRHKIWWQYTDWTVFMQRNRGKSASPVFGKMAESDWVEKLRFVPIWIQMWRNSSVWIISVIGSMDATSPSTKIFATWFRFIPDDERNHIVHDFFATASRSPCV